MESHNVQKSSNSSKKNKKDSDKQSSNESVISNVFGSCKKFFIWYDDNFLGSRAAKITLRYTTVGDQPTNSYGYAYCVVALIFTLLNVLIAWLTSVILSAAILISILLLLWCYIYTSHIKELREKENEKNYNA